MAADRLTPEQIADELANELAAPKFTRAEFRVLFGELAAAGYRIVHPDDHPQHEWPNATTPVLKAVRDGYNQALRDIFGD